ncbi:MAG: 30S ribosomal protein S8 [Candidatus Peregrinibacteria bacterium]
MNTDPIADLLTRIRNASRARHEFVMVPHSRFKEDIIEILLREGFVEKVRHVQDQKFPQLKIYLSPELRNIQLKRRSSPGRRLYVQNAEIRPVRNGYGIGVYSTSQGLLTDQEAKKAGVGGEYICEVF